MTVELNETYRTVIKGEPFLSKYDLYPSTSKAGSVNEVRLLRDVYAFCNGERDLLEIAELLGKPIQEIQSVVDLLLYHGLIEPYSAPSHS